MYSDLDASGDFFSFKFSLDGIDNSEVEHLIDHIKLKKKYFRLSNGSFLALDDPYFDALNDVLNELELEGKVKLMKI